MTFFISSNLKKISILFLVAIFVSLSQVFAFAADAPVQPVMPLSQDDPLQQLNRLNDLMKKYDTEETLRKDLEEYDKKSVNDDVVDKATTLKGSDLKFSVKEVRFTESTVLKTEELDAMSVKYVGKKVTLDELYQMVNEINGLYRRRGYTVCRAFLPEQTVKDGVVNVMLVEGKTGKIKLEKVRFTNKNYILSRTGLLVGQVGNMKELNRRVSLFNATNDAQIDITLTAGEEEATTDYILAVNEPKPHMIYVFGDNSGSASTGELRYGIGWTINSLLGIRDTLSLNFVKSDFSDSGGASYTFPVSKVGTKITASVSGNGMNMDQGYHVLNIQRPRGDSVSYSLTLTQPLCVTHALRIVADLSWAKQYSDSWYRQPINPEGKLWMDNITNKYSLGLAFTHFGKGVVWYHRHSLTESDFYKVMYCKSSYSLIYNFNFLRQQMFMNGHSLTIKASAQLTPHDLDQLRQQDIGMNTSDYFYVGGVGTVRGYTESVLGSEEGVNINVEYALPFRKFRTITPIIFVDYGKVFGAYAKYLEDTQIASVGFGLRGADNNGVVNATLWLGFPLMKQVNGSDIDDFKVHLNFYAQIDGLFAHFFKDDKSGNANDNSTKQ